MGPRRADGPGKTEGPLPRVRSLHVGGEQLNGLLWQRRTAVQEILPCIRVEGIKQVDRSRRRAFDRSLDGGLAVEKLLIIELVGLLIRVEKADAASNYGCVVSEHVSYAKPSRGAKFRFSLTLDVTSPLLRLGESPSRPRSLS